MSYAVPSLQPIRDEIAREVVINAPWVDVSGQRDRNTEYVNTTGRTYEIMMRVDSRVILRHPDGASIALESNQHANMDLSFQLKPGESVEVRSYNSISWWFERQL